MPSYIGFIAEILASAVVSGILTASLIWLSKTWISERIRNSIKSEYDQKLEAYKIQLKAQADVELEKLRAQLSTTAVEHEVKFSRLHERRAEIVAKIYALLKENHFRLCNYVKIYEPAGDDPIDVRRSQAVEAHKKFRSYYPKRLVFLPKSTAIKLEEIDVQTVKAFNEFVLSVDKRSKSGVDTTDKWMEILDRVNVGIKEALGELEDEFRRLLGDES